MIEVTCALIEQDGRVLVTQRGEGKAQAGCWEFPGGKLEAGEEEAQGLIREIKEELCLLVEPLHRLPAVVHQYPDKQICLLPWVCRLQSGELRLVEHSDFAWAEPTALTQFDWSTADIPVYKAYIQYCANQPTSR